jgi:hypothetical protein
VWLIDISISGHGLMQLSQNSLAYCAASPGDCASGACHYRRGPFCIGHNQGPQVLPAGFAAL